MTFQLKNGGENEKNVFIKRTALFEYDDHKKEVISLLDGAKNYFRLKFVSVSTDQPIYWPGEDVYLKMVFPFYAENKMKVRVQRKNAPPFEIEGVILNEAGIGVYKIMSGKDKKLEAGEYSVSVETPDKKIFEYSVFSVIEGHLGAVSFAHEFLQLTCAEALCEADGGWFLGNAGGAGNRWGNGLNFKNQIRVLNQPYNGKAVVKSLCHLPGCNGCEAGPLKTIEIKDGLLSGFLEVGGHSGPFELEVITDSGTVKNLFSRSGHVERQTSAVTSAMTNIFYATIAPYEGCEKIPGREIYLEKKTPNTCDALYLDKPVASLKGETEIKVVSNIKKVKAYKIYLNDSGNFTQSELKISEELKTGDTIKLDCRAPYVMVALAGFRENEKTEDSGNDIKNEEKFTPDKINLKYYEAWAIIFSPPAVEINLEAPETAAPDSKQKIKLSARDKLSGHGIKTHVIIEIFDNRTASRSPKDSLDSSIGDSFRDASNQISSWRDWSGYGRLEENELLSNAIMTNFAPSPSREPVSGAASASKSVTGASAIKRRARPSPIAQISGAPNGAFTCPNASPPDENIREGEKKVIYCSSVVTDKIGEALIEAEMPPQTGRCRVRAVAINKFDYIEKNVLIDCEKKSFVEADINRLLTPDSKITIKTVTINNSGKNLELEISGACSEKKRIITIKNYRTETLFDITGGEKTISFTLRDESGALVDRRDFKIFDISVMPVTYSEVIISDGGICKIKNAKNIAVYLNPARMLVSVIADMNTTMYSWFAHAEALSASIAIRAIMLRAIEDGIISGDGLRDKIMLDLNKSVKNFYDNYYDNKSGAVFPYPGSNPGVNFGLWASRNFSAALKALSGSEILKQETASQCTLLAEMLEKIISALANHKTTLYETVFFDPKTKDDIIPVEIDGKIIFKASVDPAVIDFFTSKFIPVLDAVRGGRPESSMAFIKAYDVFRFLKAFERTGILYYILINLKALLKNEDKNFIKLFNEVSKGLININDPGLIQGPAMSGGVYSAPQTLVKYLELLIEMAKMKKIKKEAECEITINGKTEKIIVSDEAYIINAAGADAIIKMPVFSALYTGNEHAINIYDHLEKRIFFTVNIDKSDMDIGEKCRLTISLDGELDAGEYYALIAAPANLSIVQSGDILSDYRGAAIYGQKSSGASKMQFITAPFRGAKDIRITLEGSFSGKSRGFVCVRHISNPETIAALKTPEIIVK